MSPNVCQTMLDSVGLIAGLISGLMLDIYVVNFVPKFLRTDDRTDYWTVFGLILPSRSAQLYAVLQERS